MLGIITMKLDISVHLSSHEKSIMKLKKKGNTSKYGRLDQNS